MDKIKDYIRKNKARVTIAGTIVSAIAIPCLVTGIPVWVLESALLGLAFIATAAALILVALAILIPPSVLAKLRGQDKILTFATDKETREYVESRLDSLVQSQKGGTVWSTNILTKLPVDTNILTKSPVEDADFVIKKLTNYGQTSDEGAINYNRIVLVRDNENEKKFVENFLNLNDNNVNVNIYVIDHQGAKANYFVRNVIPYVNLFAIEPAAGNSLMEPVVLLSFPERVDGNERYQFAIATKDRMAVRTAINYIHHITQSAGGSIITQFGNVNNYNNTRGSVLNNDGYINQVLEEWMRIGEDKNILHIGVFGSGARALHGQTPFNDINDLDFLVVVKEGTKEKVRKVIDERMRREFGDLNTDERMRREFGVLNVEWSSERGRSERFYYIRSARHIDVQIHDENDGYYTRHPLLGASVFSSYYTLYSRTQTETIDQSIEVPEMAFQEYDRVKECLKDDRFGINTFVELCSRDKDETKEIDPRRVISVTVRNFVWAVAGARVNKFDSAIQYIRDHESNIFSDKDLARLDEIYKRGTYDKKEQEEDLEHAVGFLKKLEKNLESRLESLNPPKSPPGK